MGGTPLAAAGLVVAVIEITGPAATLLLLLPFVVLVVAVLWLNRRARPVAPPSAAEAPLPEAPSAAAPPPPAPAPFPAAEAAGDGAALAALHLAAARDDIAAGHAEAAARHLRASLGAAARERDRAVEAEARLELAELARAAGDLTTACEHWQIARGLFRELARADRLGETERLMRAHGCPTDWVLTDF